MSNGTWVDGPVNSGIKKFLNEILAKGRVDAVLAPAKNKNKDSYAWFLFRDELIDEADPIPPVMPVQGARILGRLTQKGAPGKIAALFRPCEIHACIELAKIKQVDLTRVTLISFDCPGAYPLKTYFNSDPRRLDESFNKALDSGTSLEGAKNVCSICHRFTPKGADIEIGIIGAGEKGFWLLPATRKGGELVAGISHAAPRETDGRDKAVSARKQTRKEKRKNELASFQNTVAGPDNLMNTLAACINCHNCSRVCPICFCRECYFDSRALASEADNFIQRARRKGGLRFMPDLLLFHLGRMTHMSISCVSCGACQDACPADIPVSMLFSLAAQNTQALFDYEPGRSLDEPIPYTDFRFEELRDFETPYLKVYSQE